MSVPNSGSLAPNDRRLTNSSHCSHWLDTPEAASRENSNATTTRTSLGRPDTSSWTRLSMSSSGPGGRTLGAIRSAIIKLMSIRRKNAAAKITNRAIFASSTRAHTSVRSSESNHR